MFTKRLYMDFATATPLHKDVLKEMQRGFAVYGNPSAPHKEARAAKVLLDGARTRIARTLSVKAENLIFTGSGTESNNLAVYGVIDALIRKGAAPESLHIIASEIEHPSLGNQVSAWAERGVQVSSAQPNSEGIITPGEVQKYIRPETALVSITAVQSEIGQIQPLKGIARMLEPYRSERKQAMQEYFPETLFPILHTDASQSPLFVDLSPDRLGADLVSYDAQKIMGPKGVGLLYKDSSIFLEPLMRGGRQERGIRPGTENIAGIIGMAKAFELAKAGRDARVERVAKVRDYFISLLEKEVPHAELNGGIKNRIANNVNISIPGTDGDYLAVLMDKKGVAVSSRLACIQSGTPSKTIKALGKGEVEATGTLRFSFEPTVTKRDAEYAVRALKASLKIIDGSSKK